MARFADECSRSRASRSRAELELRGVARLLPARRRSADAHHPTQRVLDAQAAMPAGALLAGWAAAYVHGSRRPRRPGRPHDEAAPRAGAAASRATPQEHRQHQLFADRPAGTGRGDQRRPGHHARPYHPRPGSTGTRCHRCGRGAGAGPDSAPAEPGGLRPRRQPPGDSRSARRRVGAGARVRRCPLAVGALHGASRPRATPGGQRSGGTPGTGRTHRGQGGEERPHQAPATAGGPELVRVRRRPAARPRPRSVDGYSVSDRMSIRQPVSRAASRAF